VSRIRLANAKLDAELRKALSLLAGARATDKKAVCAPISRRGQAARADRVIQEAPVLENQLPPRAVGQEAAVPARLGDRRKHNRPGLGQRRSDVGERPAHLLHHEPLRSPLSPKARVELDLSASLRPQTYGQDLAREEAETAAKTESPSRAQAAMRAMGGMMGRLQRRHSLLWHCKRRIARMSSRSIPDKASTRRPTPVTSASCSSRHHTARLDRTPESAMLPIVTRTSRPEGVDLQPGRPGQASLCGLQLTNSTKLHLMQGPIHPCLTAVLTPADAQIEDLAPGGKRLICYARRPRHRGGHGRQGRPEQLLNVQLRKGTMIATHKLTRTVE